MLLGRNKASEMSFDDKITIPAAERVAFVIEDMWFSGLFKIWAGWSGASTGWEYNDANRTTYTRWYRDNGGHGAYRSNRTAFFLASTDMAYTLFEDVDAANFGIGYGLPSTPERPNEKVDEQGRIRDEFAGQPERRFYKRVKISYDVRNGLAYQATA
ncbi:MAG: hypothetical protein K2O10_03130, partial [Muribaculaceae bacterium]|nr:hypothetical protein [Muribaculaceae bacterium]